MALLSGGLHRTSEVLLDWLRTGVRAGRRAHQMMVEAHAQLLFSRSIVTGSLLLGITASRPRLLFGGMFALLVGRGLARQFGLSSDEWQRGPYAANLLLLGLGVASAFSASPFGVLMLGVGASVCTLLVGGLRHMEVHGLGLPPLALGFWLTHAMVLSTGRTLGLPLAPATYPASAGGFGVLDAPLGALGSLLFQPSATAGLVLSLGLLVHSRIAGLCVALALLVATLWLRAFGAIEASVAQGLYLNAALVMLALGAVWLVPSKRSLALGLLVSVALLCGASGFAASLGAHGAMLSILPFHLALYVTLLALRQRATDDAPKCVDFLPGTPEQNLSFHGERTARFPNSREPDITLPFRGTWVCTQGVDGPHTHREAWRHAWDFEVRDARGSLFEGTGASLGDYYCYRLPALAVAPGTVVALRNDITDNAVGDMDVANRFGNYVVVYHAPGVYSLLAHLEQGSVKVGVGQQIARGSLLGLVGSSGRSPRPHLHFNLQVGPEPGAPTLPCSFADAVVLERDGLLFDRTRQITEGTELRPLSSHEASQGPLGLRLGERLTLAVGGRQETLTLDVGLLGEWVLASNKGGRLRVQLGPSGYVAHDASGSADSVLPLLRACLPRLPLDDASELHFEDLVADFWALGPSLSWLSGPADVLRKSVGHRMRFVVKRTPAGLVVEGRSVKPTRFGGRTISTRAELGPRGLVLLELRCGSRCARAERVSGRALAAVAWRGHVARASTSESAQVGRR